MPAAIVSLIAFATCVLGPARPAARATSIVVNLGRYQDANTAAHSEREVDWRDADANDDTACTECFAAVELQRSLRRLTGRGGDFAIADDDKAPPGDWVLVGGPASNAAARKLAGRLPPDLGPEGYVLRTFRSGGRRVIHLAGGGRVGTLYAAYDLLHRLGCRWFAPEAIHEEVPHLDALPDVDATARPAFRTRGFHAWENRGDEAFLLWMARNRLNYWCVEQEPHALMRKLGIRMSCGAHDAQKRFLDPDGAYPYDHPRFRGDEDRPADPYPPSDDFRGDADKDGTLSRFEAHPEWFPLVAGRRAGGIRGEFGTNYCTSNDHATAEFMKRYVAALIDGPYRDADVVRFWTLDGGKWCPCPACCALGTPTDRNLRLVGALDREIKAARREGRIHRPILIRFLAYADVLSPPTRPLPEGFDYDTCMATFFPIRRSYVHAFADPNSPANARYLAQLRGWVEGPARHYRGEVCLGEYYNVSAYKCLPLCLMHTMAADIPFYHRMGARDFHYMHCITARLGSRALTNYQMARQLWDVQTDCEALWEDYFARRYGPAAETMAAFHASLEKMLANVTELKYGLARRLDRGAEDLFPSSELRYERTEGVACSGPTLVEMVGHGEACRRLIDRALAMDLPKRVRARIAEDEQVFAYGERTIGYYDACVQAFAAARAGKPDAAKGHLARAVELAEFLRKDTAGTRHSSSHANAANAFEATGATGAPALLRKLLGPTR
ncbi:MAG TPA: DUF4838 domain-containing protein [Phycisphaerae bacterium]|nr:DUF4838 domain-containing protein [Phycisphaerae bacterium]